MSRAGPSRVLALVCVSAGAVAAQLIPDLPLPPLGDLLPVPTLGDLRREQPPLTTSIEDVENDCPWLDWLEPEYTVPAGELARDADGAFLVPRGHWRFDIQGFCLRAGTGRPGSGSAYLYAPLKGPKAPLVIKLLSRGADDPAVTQEAMQDLLWAVIAKADWRDVPEASREVAERLLSPNEQRQLRAGSVGVIPPELTEGLFGELPEILRPVFEAENALRSLFAQGNVSSADLAAVAVRDLPPPEPMPGLPPWGRWSRHPNGLYLRFEPIDYPRCVIHVIHHQPVRIERDALGRIVSLSMPGGCRIEARYLDQRGLPVPGYPELLAYRFALLRALAPDGSIAWADESGWTLVCQPAGGLAAAPAGWRFANQGLDEVVVEEFEGFLERIGEWGEVKDIVDEVTERWEKRLGRKMTPEELDNFFNVKHFNDGFDAAVKGGNVEKTEWLVENLKLGLDAYIQAGDIVYNPDLLGGPVTINNNTPPTPMKVESIVATPANTDAQRQGFWARLFGW